MQHERHSPTSASSAPTNSPRRSHDEHSSDGPKPSARHAASSGSADAAAASSSTQDAAARALLQMKQKLQGYEDPNGEVMSVEGQVRRLVSEAQDPNNLCRLFHGWAPWL